MAQHTASLGDNESQNAEDRDNGDGNNEENGVSNGDPKKESDMKHYSKKLMGDIKKKSKEDWGLNKDMVEYETNVERWKGNWVED